MTCLRAIFLSWRNLLLWFTFFFGSRALRILSTFDSIKDSFFPSDLPPLVDKSASIAAFFRSRPALLYYSFKIFRDGSQCLIIRAWPLSRISNSMAIISLVDYSSGAIIPSGAVLITSPRAYRQNSTIFKDLFRQPCTRTWVVSGIGLAFAHASIPCWAVWDRNCLSATILFTTSGRHTSITCFHIGSVFRPCLLFSEKSSRNSSSAFHELLDLKLVIWFLRRSTNLPRCSTMSLK